MPYLVSAVLILMGAVVMLFSIITARGLRVLTSFIPEGSRKEISRSLNLHRGMMLFFLLGYCVVAAAFIFRIDFLGEIFIGTVFLLGAVFVLVGLRLQTRMLLEIKSTVWGLLPICASCKQIRKADSDPQDQDSWQSVESFISARAKADFTHGFCPDCLQRLYPDAAD
jgi:xanthine/uracil permease